MPIIKIEWKSPDLNYFKNGVFFHFLAFRISNLEKKCQIGNRKNPFLNYAYY